MATPLESLVSVTMQGTNCIGLGRSGPGGTITGLYYSSDSGENWYISNITAVSAVNNNPGPIKMSGAYAIACTNTLTYYSSDYGHTWTASDLPSGKAKLSLSFSGPLALIGSNTYNIGGVISGATSYYSTNYGENWTESTFSGLTPPIEDETINCYSVEIDASNGKAVAHTDKGIFYSDSAGTNFTKSTYPGSDTNAASKAGVARLNYVVASVTGIGILYSTNSGQTFTNTFPFVSNSLEYSIAMDILGNCIFSIYSGPEYNIYYSSDYGATWAISTPGTYAVGSSQFGFEFALAISNGVAVSSGKKYSTNNGQTWSNSVQPSASNSNPGAISIVGSNVITSNQTNTYYSTNGGATYTIATLLPPGPALTPTVLSGFSIPTKTVGDSSFSITPPTTNSDGAFTYTSSDLSVATIDGTTITIVGAGTSTITASQAETATYTAETITASFQVNAPGPIICFLEGSKILHLNDENQEEYIEIEKLKKGDFIKTVKNDYKKIEDIGYSKMYNNVNDIRSTDKLYKCSKDVYPELIEDLVITGAHSILVSNFKDEQQLEKTQDVLGKIYVTGMFYRLPACVDDRTTIYEIEGIHTIWHFSLENENYYSNYGVFANGLLVESCSKRMMKECGMHLLNF